MKLADAVSESEKAGVEDRLGGRTAHDLVVDLLISFGCERILDWSLLRLRIAPSFCLGFRVDGLELHAG